MAEIDFVVLLRRAERPREGSPRVCVLRNRCDLIVLRTRQSILSGHNLDVVGHSIAESVLCQAQLALRQIEGGLRDAHLLLGRLNVQDCLAEILFNASRKIVCLCLQTVSAAVEFLLLSRCGRDRKSSRENSFDSARRRHRAEIAAGRAIVSI